MYVRWAGVPDASPPYGYRLLKGLGEFAPWIGISEDRYKQGTGNFLQIPKEMRRAGIMVVPDSYLDDLKEGSLNELSLFFYDGKGEDSWCDSSRGEPYKGYFRFKR